MRSTQAYPSLIRLYEFCRDQCSHSAPCHRLFHCDGQDWVTEISGADGRGTHLQFSRSCRRFRELLRSSEKIQA